MAIYHLSSKIITRSQGSSAVASAAYRHGTSMYFEKEDKNLSYAGKHEVVHTEFSIPNDTPAWVRSAIDGRSASGASEAIWNAVENFEKRKDAQLSREVEFALPVELNKDQNIQLARNFAKYFTDKGMIADWAYHDLKHNPHVHMMLTLRPLTEEGFGPKKIAVLDEGGNPMRLETAGGSRIIYKLWSGDKDDLLAWRALWADLTNAALREAGHSISIDHRSYAEQGVVREPGHHLGVRAHGMMMRGAHSDRVSELLALELRNLNRLNKSPHLIAMDLTRKVSTFTRQDVETYLSALVRDPGEVLAITDRVLQAENVMQISDVDRESVFTTIDMIRLERQLIDLARKLNGDNGFKVERVFIDQAIGKANAALDLQGAKLSEQQVRAIEALLQPGRLSNIVGYAGTGKSTLLRAAREAWAAQGYRVQGVAIAGKAARGLQAASGIHSRTIASAELFWKGGGEALGARDVLVVDEAGMVGSRQLHTLLSRARAGGAKVVLVGDPSQLPAISAGAAFRGVLERTSATVITEIRRQATLWQLEASLRLAKGDVARALGLYEENGSLHGFRSKAGAIKAATHRFVEDLKAGRDVAALAHANKDVSALNANIRLALMGDGVVKPGAKFETLSGARDFGAGDRIVFLRNSKSLGVSNGSFGQVVEAAPEHLKVKLEGGRVIDIQSKTYDAIDYGYAVTIHKAQGATFDKVHLIAGRSMDRSLTYVGMTRHKSDADLYYSKGSFKDLPGGVIAGLSEAREKGLTLDFEDGDYYREAVQFGLRRGYLSQGGAARWLLKRIEQLGARVAAAWGAFVGTKGGGAWLIRPMSLTQGEIVARAKAEGMAAAEAYKDLLSDRIARAYRQPEKVLNALFDIVREADRDLVNQAIKDLRHAPRRFGELNGKDGKIPQKILHEARLAAGALKRFDGSMRSVMSTALARLQAGQVDGVRPLSLDAVAVLDKAIALTKTEPDDGPLWRENFGTRLKTLDELMRWRSVLVGRFGSEAGAIKHLSDLAERGGGRGLIYAQAVSRLRDLGKVKGPISLLMKTLERQIRR